MSRTLLFLALLSLSSVLHAQAPATIAPHQIPRLADGIVIDGQLDDAAWAAAGEFDLGYEISPGDNTPATEKTTGRIGYTADALYVSFRARDARPAEIRAHLRDRDAAFRDDFIGIIVDTFDDQRRGYEFFVNPLGVQMDLIVDQASGGSEDSAWDGLWSSAGRITETGYEVEMRIPFATLRFREGEQAKRWGLMMIRSQPRSTRRQFANNKVSRDSNCLICTFDKFEGMAGVRPGRNLDVVPSITVARPEFRDTPDGQWRNDGVEVEPGVDVSWAPTPNLTLNGTINPDFSQVETDQAQLNLNDSFALFFPEKRPFFLEGADYFSTPFDVLYTRQISDPTWGLRITGRAGDGAYGGFIAQDATTSLLVPGVLGSQFRQLDQAADVAVARYRHNLDEHTTVGVIGTFRHGDDYANDVIGVDGRWQKGAHTVTAQLLRSESEYPLSLGFADASPSGNASWTYYNFGNRAWSVNAGRVQVDEGFRADLGFIGQVGYEKWVLGGGHTWYGEEGDRIRRVSVSADADITHRFDGQLLEREFEAGINLQGPLQSSMSLNGLARVRFWDGQMFDETNVGVSGSFTTPSSLRFGGSVNAGQRVDLLASREGDYLSLNAWGQLDLGRGVELTPDVSWSRLQRDGGTAYTALVFDTRLSWQLDTRQRLRLTLQGSDVDRDPTLYSDAISDGGRDWGGQVLYSYKVNPRTAFYGGVSYGAVRDEQNEEMFGNSRGVFLKYSYGWQPGS